MKKGLLLKRNSRKEGLCRDNKGRFIKGFSASPHTQFKKGQHWRKRKPFWNKKWLENEYIYKKRSSSEIAKDFNIGDTAILFWLKKHAIPRRNISETRKIKKWGLSGKENGMYGRCGSQNPRWIDGSSPERQKMYARSFWAELRKSVYEKDNFKCQRCDNPHTSKNKLHAHHIKPWAGNIDMRFDLKNIITLCNNCHNWVHSKKNKQNEYLSF